MNSSTQPITSFSEQALALIGWMKVDPFLRQKGDQYGYPVIAAKLRGYLIMISTRLRERGQDASVIQPWIDAAGKIALHFSPDDRFYANLPRELAAEVFSYIYENICRTFPSIAESTAPLTNRW